MKADTIPVALAHASYEIHVGSDIAAQIQKVLQDLEYNHRRYVFVVDKAVCNSHPGFFEQFKEVPTLQLVASEKKKTLETVQLIYDFILDKKLDRKSVVFAIGGGVIGDMAGFAAATYMRGIDFYQVPTSFLAMVDSSIGGKTGVNLKEGKSLVGAFHQPKGVFIDIDFLKTLPSAEFSSGMAEVIKSALLADNELFEMLDKEPALNPGSPKLQEVIRRTCKIKADIVVEDAKEVTGRRALLNLGHTFAHAIETLSNYTEYLHGEAVAIGVLIAARLSQIQGYLNDADIEKITKVFLKYNLPVTLKTPLKIEALNEALIRDKKTESGELRFICIKKIGEAYIQDKIENKWLHLIWKEAGAID